MSSVKHIPDERRLAGIEAIRFCSALAVVIRHYFFLLTGPQQEAFVQAHPLLNSLFFVATGYGYFAVPVFWLLSGFIFFYTYMERIALKAVTIREFFILRFSRLYPLHFVTLVAVAVLQALHMARNGYYFVFYINDLKHFILQMFFASNWALKKIPDFSFNAPVWSVSVEIPIYMFFFLWVFFLRPSMLKTLVVIVCSFIGYALTLPGSMFFLCAFFFYTGGFAFQFLHAYGTWMERYKTPFILTCMLMIIGLGEIIRLHINQLDTYLAIIIIACVLMVLSYQYHLIITGRVARHLNWLGNLTYASYLLHFPLQLAFIVICQTQGWRTDFFYDGRVFSFYLITVFTTSHFVFKYFEHPVQICIRRHWLLRIDRCK